MATSSSPRIVFTLLALFAVGCVVDARRQGPGTVNWASSLSFQVDPTSPLFAPAQQAAAEWSKAIGRPVSVSADGAIPIFFVSKLDPDACGPTAMGCGYNGKDARIEVLESTPAKALKPLLLHEMGHQLRGERGHLETPIDAIMADPIRGNVLTSADIAFICERFDCELDASQPLPGAP